VSIELPRQPTGSSRRCYKCKVIFLVQPQVPRARQCEPCRDKAKTNPNRIRPQRGDGHTHEWDQRSLGLFEAATLRMAWGPKGGDFVTADCHD
jgi:hypothetical protein